MNCSACGNKLDKSHLLFLIETKMSNPSENDIIRAASVFCLLLSEQLQEGFLVGLVLCSTCRDKVATLLGTAVQLSTADILDKVRLAKQAKERQN